MFKNMFSHFLNTVQNIKNTKITIETVLNSKQKGRYISYMLHKYLNFVKLYPKWS